MKKFSGLKAFSSTIAFVLIYFIALGGFLWSDSIETNRALSAEEISILVGPQIAQIVTFNGTGSAILLADGYVLTNHHVIAGFEDATVSFDTGEEYESVKVVAYDISSDLALLGPIKKKGTLAFASTQNFEPGKDVYFVGYPDEYEEKPKTTISRGIISRIRSTYDDGLKILQTDAAISGGQSGGAMVNSKGEIVGVSSLGSNSFGFAIAAENVEESISSMMDNKEVPFCAMPPAYEEDYLEPTTYEFSFENRHESKTYFGYVEEGGEYEFKSNSNDISSFVLYDFVASEPIALSKELVDSSSVKASANQYIQEVFKDKFAMPNSEGVLKVTMPKQTFFIFNVYNDSLSELKQPKSFETDLQLSEILPAEGRTIDEYNSFTSEICAFEPIEDHRVFLEKDEKYQFNTDSRFGRYFLSIVSENQGLEENLYDKPLNTNYFGTSYEEEFKAPESGYYSVILLNIFRTSWEYTISVDKVSD